MSPKNFYIFLVFLLGAPSLLFAEGVELEAYKVGAMLHLTGDYAMEGQAFQRGIELATEEINKAGGINGKPLKVDFQDSLYQVKQCAGISQKFASDKSVLGVLISTMHETIPAAPVLEKVGLPTIVLWDAMPELEEMGDSLFSIGPWAPDTGEKASRFALLTKKAKTAVVLSQQHDWSQAVSDAFVADFKKRGGKILMRESILQETADYKSILTKVKRINPDIIYAPLVFNVVAFAKQKKALKISADVIMADNLNEAVISNGGDAFNGFFHTTVADPNGEKAEKLKAKYLARYGAKLELPLFAAWGYDGVQSFAASFKAGAETREAVQEALYRIKNIEGLNGNISFNEKGSSPKFISVFEVQEGKLVLVEKADIPESF